MEIEKQEQALDALAEQKDAAYRDLVASKRQLDKEENARLREEAKRRQEREREKLAQLKERERIAREKAAKLEARRKQEAKKVKKGKNCDPNDPLCGL